MWMEVENTLAYYDTATTTAVMSFVVLAPAQSYKNIYGHNFKCL